MYFGVLYDCDKITDKIKKIFLANINEATIRSLKCEHVRISIGREMFE